MSFIYFMQSLDRNSKNRWANPVNWPFKETKNLQCENKRCNKERCIEAGINAELYKKWHGAFYMDTSDKYITCEN